MTETPKQLTHDGPLLLCCAALLCCLALGGGTTPIQMSDVIAEALCLPLLIAACWRLREQASSLTFRLGLAVVALIAMLALAQLVHLPPTLWTKLPGREPLAEAYRLAGTDLPWMGVSLAPVATRQSLLSLLPPLTVFVTAAQLDFKQRRQALMCLIVFACLSVVVGLLQSVQGPASPLRFHHPGETEIVGFFANRNHLAALLYVCVLIVGAWGLAALIEGKKSRSAARKEQPNLARFLLLGGLFAALATLLLGIVLAQSRAGFGFGIMAIFAAFAITLPGTTGSVARRPAVLMALAVILFGVLSVNYVLYDTLSRLQGGLADNIRERVAALTKPLVFDYFPVGTGFGSFVPVYEAHEQIASSFYGRVNRAHNEFLEWGLEGGLAAYVLLAAGLAWLVLANVTAWRRKDYPGLVDARLARGCAFAPILLLAHSYVDYPLRTIAVMGAVALCAGVSVEPLRRVGGGARTAPAAT